jgi:putative transposase
MVAAPAKNAAVEEVAAKYGVNRSTLYRWLLRYQEGGGRLSALAPKKCGSKNPSRLDPKVEALVCEAVDNFFLQQPRKPVTSVWDDLETTCLAIGLEPPHINTLRNRIKRLDEYLVLERRYSAKTAREKLGALPSAFKGASAPHALVQIDHTKVDVLLVDEETRLPIGRPWLTLVEDIYSRMVLGFHISLDPPSELSVGLAIAHAVLPKESWLAEHGIDLVWPCQGLLGCVYVDSGLDLNGSLMRRGCEEYGIDLQNRPLGQPDFGGHIERLMGTLMRKTHELPGTTYSSVAEKGDYDATAQACVTLQEFETWLARYILGVYHNRPHRGIDRQTPIQRYESWFQEQGKNLGIIGAPLPEDPHRFRLDFLPSKEQTIQRYGVEMLHGTLYSADTLRPFMKEKDPEDPKKGRRFRFAYDPRDISIIYFWHPVAEEYTPIPWKDSSRRPMSLWELRRKAQEKAPEDPHSRSTIRQTRASMQAIQEGAQAATQKIRRDAARTKQHRTKNIHRDIERATTCNPEQADPNTEICGSNTQDEVPWTPVAPYSVIE